MKLNQAKRVFRNNWIAFQFLNEAKEEGRVVAHARRRHELFDKIRKTRALEKAKVYVTYTGRILPKGYAVILFLH